METITREEAAKIAGVGMVTFSNYLIYKKTSLTAPKPLRREKKRGFIYNKAEMLEWIKLNNVRQIYPKNARYKKYKKEKILDDGFPLRKIDFDKIRSFAKQMNSIFRF